MTLTAWIILGVLVVGALASFAIYAARRAATDDPDYEISFRRQNRAD